MGSVVQTSRSDSLRVRKAGLGSGASETALERGMTATLVAVAQWIQGKGRPWRMFTRDSVLRSAFATEPPSLSWITERLGGHDRLRVFSSLYRGVTFVLAAVQLLVTPLFASVAWPTYLVLAIVGTYSIVKMLVPFRWHRNDRLTRIVLGADVVLCVSLLLVSGGLGSPFLLYSLNPVLTLGLFARREGAIAGAAVLTGAVTITEIVPSVGLGSIYDGTILGSAGLVTVYGFLCVLTALLPFFVNVRASRQIEETTTRDERRRLAAEMHDSLAQDLEGLRLRSEVVRQHMAAGNEGAAHAELNKLRSGIETACQDTREIIGTLRGEALSEIGLGGSLARYVHDFGQRTGIRTEFHMCDGQARMSSLAELHVLRVVHEALTNVAKHSGATLLEVRFDADRDGATIVVKDNGSGFEASETQAEDGGHHVGLQVMRERAEAVDGAMSIASAPGEGTTVQLRVPQEGG